MDDRPINDLLHRRLPARQRGKGHAAADGLAENRQIWHETKMLLRTPSAETESGDRFVCNHEHALAVAELTDRFDHPWHWHHTARVAHDRLEDDCRDLAFVFLHLAAQMVRIVPARDDKRVQHCGNHPLARMQPRGSFIRTPFFHRRSEAHETFIRPAMIPTFEFQDQRPPRMAACETQRREHHLRRGVVESYQLS